MTPTPRHPSYYRRISKMRQFKGRRPLPTFEQIQANPRMAKVIRDLKKEFANRT